MTADTTHPPHHPKFFEIDRRPICGPFHIFLIAKKFLFEDLISPGNGNPCPLVGPGLFSRSSLNLMLHTLFNSRTQVQARLFGDPTLKLTYPYPVRPFLRLNWPSLQETGIARHQLLLTCQVTSPFPQDSFSLIPPMAAPPPPLPFDVGLLSVVGAVFAN